jgi:hypothetical protein
MFSCLTQKASAETNNSSKGPDLERIEDPTLVNRWYYEGCLTGCAQGYLLGYLIGRHQATDPRVKQSVKDYVTDWQGAITKEIQLELDDILSNEVRPASGDLPQSPPRVISTPQQLPIRHAGIYSTFHAAVHDGFKDGYIGKDGAQITETNKYLERYAASHTPTLPEGLAKRLVQQHFVYFLD